MHVLQYLRCLQRSSVNNELRGKESFLGAFAKLRKAAVSFVMSVRMEQLVHHWTDFHEIWYLSIFRKYVEKLQVSLKSDNNSGCFT